VLLSDGRGGIECALWDFMTNNDQYTPVEFLYKRTNYNVAKLELLLIDDYLSKTGYLNWPKKEVKFALLT